MIQHKIFNRFQFLSEPILPLSDSQYIALNRFKNKLNSQYYSIEEVPCLCGSTDSFLIAKVDRYALPVQTHICNNCGIMWTSPRMTEDSLIQFYNQDYRGIYVGDPQAPDDFFFDQVKHGKEILEYLEPIFRSEESGLGTVFDVGCGAGGVLLPFKEVGYRTFGCDLGLNYLQRGLDEGLSLHQGSAEILRQYGNANLIILSHVLEHFSNPVEKLYDIAKMLDEGGHLYIELPGIFNIYKTYGDFLLFLQNAHLYHFTLQTLTQVLNQIGFELIKGDEQIRALFKKKSAPITNYSIQRSQDILTYVLIGELMRPLKKNRNLFKRRVKKMFKKMYFAMTSF